jgi:hypothetical protein
MPLEFVTDVWDIVKGKIVQSFTTLRTIPLTEHWSTNLLYAARGSPPVAQSSN